MVSDGMLEGSTRLWKRDDSKSFNYIIFGPDSVAIAVFLREQVQSGLLYIFLKCVLTTVKTIVKMIV